MLKRFCNNRDQVGVVPLTLSHSRTFPKVWNSCWRSSVVHMPLRLPTNTLVECSGLPLDSSTTKFRPRNSRPLSSLMARSAAPSPCRCTKANCRNTLQLTTWPYGSKMADSSSWVVSNARLPTKSLTVWLLSMALHRKQRTNVFDHTWGQENNEVSRIAASCYRFSSHSERTKRYFSSWINLAERGK